MKLTNDRLQEIDNDVCDQLANPKYGWSPDIKPEELRALIYEVQNHRDAALKERSNET